ncbi:DMT family transporter [Novosphingobium bradum]|uniref:DMT family transporter n=1 Tax=Novosphingobium bradum TaxID=1737444 RepID=A0ABV7ITE7_9SPHN
MKPKANSKRGRIITREIDHRRGLLLALAAFALLSCGDAVIKSMAGAWPPLGVAALRYSFGMVGLGAVVYRREGLSGFRTRRRGFQGLRGVGMAGATLGFFTAIFVMPLADAVAIGFVGPMVTVLLAALFLGEPVRRRSWLAIGAAFVGVLVVLRPNLLALGPVALLPLFAAVSNAFYMIGNRLTIGDVSILAQQFFVAVICAPILVVAAVIGHLSGHPGFALSLPAWHVVARCALVALSASTAHWMIFRATMLAGAGPIAPMAYVQIVVVSAIGWLAFGSTPQPASLVGIAVIVAAGLVLWRGGQAPAPRLDPKPDLTA